MRAPWGVVVVVAVAVMAAVAAAAPPPTVYWLRVNGTHGRVCAPEWAAAPPGVPWVAVVPGALTVRVAVEVLPGGGSGCVVLQLTTPTAGSVGVPYILGPTPTTAAATGVVRWVGPKATRVRLGVVGDGGWGSTAQLGVAQGLEAFARRTGTLLDATVFAGDNAYMTGSLQDYQVKFFGRYGPLLRGAPVMGVLGNHDVRADGGATWARLLRRGAGPSRYYTTTWGAVGSRPLVLVLVLDTSAASALTAGGPQATWLAAQLQAARATRPVWMVAVAHYPPHGPTGGEAPGVALRTVALPLLVAAGVHVLVTAHAHTYLRGTAPGGMLHVVAGTGGAPLRAGPVPVTAPYVVGNSVHSSLVLDVNATTLAGFQVSTTGAVVDTFRLGRGTAAAGV